LNCRHLLFVFILKAIAILIFNTQAFTTFSTNRAVSLQTTSDLQGLISLEPYGENGIYFNDDGNDGTYEFNITDIPLQVVTYENIMKITNNLNNAVNVKIQEHGGYVDNVGFSSDVYNLELEGRTITVGDTIYVDLIIDATGLEGVSLLDSIDIVAYQDSTDIYNIHRQVVLTTLEGEVYDPYLNDMPANAAYLAQIAYEIIESGGTISQGSSCFEDMGIDPAIWNNNINGYTYEYFDDYGGVIHINNTQAKIYMELEGSTISVNKNRGIKLSITHGYYYVFNRGSWEPNATLQSYY